MHAVLFQMSPCTCPHHLPTCFCWRRLLCCCHHHRQWPSFPSKRAHGEAAGLVLQSASKLWKWQWQRRKKSRWHREVGRWWTWMHYDVVLTQPKLETLIANKFIFSRLGGWFVVHPNPSFSWFVPISSWDFFLNKKDGFSFRNFVWSFLVGSMVFAMFLWKRWEGNEL